MSTDMSLWFAKLKKQAELQRFSLHNANNTPCELFVKRDDLIDSFISGNKLRKLEGNLKAAIAARATDLMTFGGAYSNHLLASAAAARQVGLPIIGCVRGDELSSSSNHILLKCHELGMQLNFVNRTSYASIKHQSGLQNKNGKLTWVIPEGGANSEGVWGCSQIYDEAVIQNNGEHFDAVFIAQGTTTTSLGILAAIPPTSTLFVVPVLKGFDSKFEMQKLIDEARKKSLTTHLHFPLHQVHFLDQYHHGGYAKSSNKLMSFINLFNQSNQFQVEPVYTGKALFALSDTLPNLDPQIKNILFIHTGGVV